MRCHRWIAAVIAFVVIATLGPTSTSTSAQSDASLRREIARQQRLILQQQRQIQAYQRQGSAPRQAQAAPEDDRSFFSKLNCPRGYSMGGASGPCYPDLPVPVTVYPAR